MEDEEPGNRSILASIFWKLRRREGFGRRVAADFPSSCSRAAKTKKKAHEKNLMAAKIPWRLLIAHDDLVGRLIARVARLIARSGRLGHLIETLPLIGPADAIRPINRD